MTTTTVMTANDRKTISEVLGVPESKVSSVYTLLASPKVSTKLIAEKLGVSMSDVDVARALLDVSDKLPNDTAVETTPVMQVQANKGKVDLELIVTNMLHEIGVPPHIKGYNYIRRSIIMAVETPEVINSVTKQLYPTVAEEYKTTSSRAERAIRHAIEVAWDRGDVNVLNSYFGYTVDSHRGKPTNSEFIAMLADKIRLEYKL